ncbi:hypothetical protein JMUB7520_27410 [Staphylococcus aureus]
MYKRQASLSGLKLETFKQHILDVGKYNLKLGEEPKEYPLESIVLAVDNDEAGKNFVSSIVNTYENDFTIDLPLNSKDWNEQLKKDKACLLYTSDAADD